MTAPDHPDAPLLDRWTAEPDKRAFLLRHRTRTARLPVPVDTAQLQADWRAFAARTDLRLAPARPSDAPPDAFAATTGFPMPDALAALHAVSDGSAHGTDSGTGLRGYRLLSAEETAGEWANWKAIFDEWTLDELTGNHEPDGARTLGVYTAPFWVPFLHDGSGNVAALDLLPGEAGRRGQVIAFGADEVMVRWCADSLGSFVRLLRDGADPLGRGLA